MFILFSDPLHSCCMSSSWVQVILLFIVYYNCLLLLLLGFPGSSAVKNLPADVGDPREASSIPWLGRSAGVGNDNLLKYSCLQNPMDRGAWWATVQGVVKSWTQLND